MHTNERPYPNGRCHINLLDSVTHTLQFDDEDYIVKELQHAVGHKKGERLALTANEAEQKIGSKKEN